MKDRLDSIIKILQDNKEKDLEDILEDYGIIKSKDSNVIKYKISNSIKDENIQTLFVEILNFIKPGNTKKVDTYLKNLNEKLSLDNSLYSFSNNISFVEEKYKELSFDDKLSLKEVRDLIVNLSTKNREYTKEELLNINMYFLSEGNSIPEERFTLYFQTKGNVSQHIISDIKNNLDKSKNDIKELLSGNHFNFLNNDKDEEKTRIELSNMILHHIETEVLANNKVTEIKSWLILFKDDYDNGLKDIEPFKSKQFTSLDILNHINDNAMNGNKPFNITNEKPLEFKFVDGGTGKIDVLYKDINNQLHAIDATVDKTGSIDRKNTYIQDQQLARHFLKYLMYLIDFNENGTINHFEIDNKVDKVKNVEEVTIQLIKEIQEKKPKIDINYTFFPDIVLPGNKMIRSIYNSIYHSLHLISGDYGDDRIATTEKKEFVDTLLKNIKSLSTNNIYLYGELLEKTRELDHNRENKITQKVRDKELTYKGQTREETFYDNYMFEYNQDINHFIIDIFKEISSIELNEELDFFDLEKEEQINKISSYISNEKFKQILKDSSLWKHIDNVGRSSKSMEDFLERLPELLFNEKIRKELLGDYLYFSLINNEQELNNMSFEQLRFFEKLFKGAGIGINQFAMILENRKRIVSEKREEETKREVEEKEKRIEEKDLISLINKMGLHEYLEEDDDFKDILKENISKKELYQRIKEEAKINSAVEKVTKYIEKNLSNYFKEFLTKPLELNQIKETLSNPPKEPKKVEELSEDIKEQTGRNKSQNNFK